MSRSSDVLMAEVLRFAQDLEGWSILLRRKLWEENLDAQGRRGMSGFTFEVPLRPIPPLTEADGRMRLLVVSANAHGCGVVTSAGTAQRFPISRGGARIPVSDGLDSLSLELVPVIDSDVGYRQDKIHLSISLEEIDCAMAGLARDVSQAARLLQASMPAGCTEQMTLLVQCLESLPWPTNRTAVLRSRWDLENLGKTWDRNAFPEFSTVGERKSHEIACARLSRASSQVHQRVLRRLGESVDSSGMAARRVGCLGYAHTDFSWLWPLKADLPHMLAEVEAQCQLLDDFPNYRFGQSSALLYRLVKDAAPGLFERVSKHVASGRWVLLGGMWVEPDCNLVSGEVLARQVELGQGFFLKNFEKTSTAAWLPDTFGFAGNLPQILRWGDMSSFYTAKFRMNDTTSGPAGAFLWVGVDGSPIVGYSDLRRAGYRGSTDWDDLYRSAPTDGEDAPRVVGFSSGCGPRREDLEHLASAGASGLLNVLFEEPSSWTSRLDQGSLSTVSGALYLQAHRGVYSLNPRLKSAVRNAERRLIELEALLASSSLPIEGDSLEVLRRGWEDLCELTSHDGVSGVCVGTVNASLLSKAVAIVRGCEAVTSKFEVHDGWVRNDSLFPRAIGKRPMPVDGGQTAYFNEEVLPPLAVVRLTDLTPARDVVVARDHAVSNAHICIEFSSGLIKVRDLRSGFSCEWQLSVLYDRSHYWDAWEISPRVGLRELERFTVEDVTAVALPDGQGRLVLRLRFRDSRLEWAFNIQPGADLVRCSLTGVWNEVHTYVRLVAHSSRIDHVLCESPFGTDSYSGSDFSRGKFEVPTLRFVRAQSGDQPLVGVVGDSLGGVVVEGTSMAVGLFRSPVFPDPFGASEVSLNLGISMGQRLDVGDLLGSLSALTEPEKEWARCRRSGPFVFGPGLVMDSCRSLQGRVWIRVHEVNGSGLGKPHVDGLQNVSEVANFTGILKTASPFRNMGAYEFRTLVGDLRR